MNNLNAKQLTDYKEKGYAAPIDVLSSEETLVFKPIPKSFESEIFFACEELTTNKSFIIWVFYK